MAIRTFLAMTAAEFGSGTSLPPKIAWMACHFSPYCTGLSNLPRKLPPGSMLVVDDITPIHGHDREVIAAQLTERVKTLKCSGVLLDFQRSGCEETAKLSAYLPGVLPCPVAVSELYGRELDCPVFLPPCPHHVPLSDHIAPFQGRDAWLELALDSEVITLTESGFSVAPLPAGDAFEGGHKEENLHCHYNIKVSDTEARFTLWRTKEDLDALLAEAENLGITTTVGLYQELRQT